ncbi:transcriptional regulator [Christiangramia fulva]|uniref:Transcriptional regulator n=1 Tax=Christiangramia fulva TaxID=2126553 RepID=A0A2R3Z4F8_9FLAO|nr:response regulator [Christiangramia fulva]AVR45102.1 transcriptional regulator [Christiangramia fulva]
MAKILLIEDDICLQQNIQEILEFAGHKVRAAADGEKGLRLAFEDPPELVLCDIILPSTDGYQILKKLSANSQTKRIPFIFLTAKSGIDDIRKGMNLGADDYIVKPFEEKQLLETIKTRLKKFRILKGPDRTYDFEGRIKIESVEAFRNYFLENGEKLKLGKNKLLFNENQPANYVFLLRSGIIKTRSTDEYGKEIITNIYHKNNFLGFYSFNRNIHYPEQAKVIEPAKLLRLPVSQVQAIFKDNPQLTMEWAEYISRDMIELKEHLLQTAYASVHKKTVNTILELSEKFDLDKNEFSRISRGDLAHVAGISKESFIRSLSVLKQDGLIKINGKNIEIIDMEGLKRIK